LYRDLPYRVMKHVDEVLWVILSNEVGDLDILVAALDEEENAQDQLEELHIEIEKLLQLVTMRTKRNLRLASFVLEFFF
jgi:hypothetical protein